VSFVKNVPPRYSLLLNVMRDQLDRFGEIDATAKMLAIIAKSTTETVILNREDPRVATIAGILTYQKVSYFGLSPKLTHLFPNDDEMRGKSAQTSKRQTPQTGVVLESLNDGIASFTMDGHSVSTALKLQGIYNVYNAAAALALTEVIIGETMDKEKLVDALAEITPAFGRGETVTIGGQPLELVLVKNPSGFRLSLSSFKPGGYATMIAINDNYADGRDMSWLWDVEFDSLKTAGVAEVTGMRSYDMALRLQYDEVLISHVEPDLTEALRHFITSNADSPKRIFCTYTAMLALRRELSKMTKVEVIS
jgi:UDP-N-acetylmuramyl tripeptide synthase